MSTSVLSFLKSLKIEQCITLKINTKKIPFYNFMCSILILFGAKIQIFEELATQKKTNVIFGVKIQIYEELATQKEEI